MVKKYGLIIPPILTREEGAEHILGGLSGVSGPIINPSGDWTAYLPEKEPQSKDGFDTKGCGIWGTLNALETLVFFKTGIRVNYSDRYVALYAKNEGILDPKVGSDVHKVAELIRLTCGLLKEDKLPFSDIVSAEEFYTNPVNWTELIRDASGWYNDWSFSHEWAWGSIAFNKVGKLEESLTKGTSAVSVHAWRYNSEKGWYEKPKGAEDTHWTQLVKINEDGTYQVFDSYDNFEKRLAPDFDFQIAKVYYLTPSQRKITIMQSIIFLAQKAVFLLQELISRKAIEAPKTPEIEAIIPEPNNIAPPKPSKIGVWAKAIEREEGFYSGSRSQKNNNPGNIKFTTYTKSLGALRADKDNFCIFPTYDSGFSALSQFLRDACTDKLKSYKGDMTLVAFTQIYAQPPNTGYATRVAQSLGVNLFTKIKELL